MFLVKMVLDAASLHRHQQRQVLRLELDLMLELNLESWGFTQRPNPKSMAGG